MRTLRNVTFIVLCAMVYLAPVQASSAGCGPVHWEPHYGCAGGPGVLYWGECADCNDGFDFAIDTCGGLSISEYWCYDGFIQFCCMSVMD